MKKKSSLLCQLSIHSLLMVGLATMVLPFFWMISSSLKTRGDLYQIPPSFIPEHPTLINFIRIFRDYNFFTPFANSIIVTVSFTVLTLLLSSMAAYAFSKLDFPGRNSLFTFLVATMIVPGIVNLIPLFLIVKKMGWLDTYQALIVVPAASVFNIFFFRQFMNTIPDELFEAARIDGAKEWRIFSTIMIPLIKPALATMAYLNFIGKWNEFLWPAVVINDKYKWTLEVAIYNLFGQNKDFDFGLIMAGTVIVLTPLLILFLFTQKFILKGISFTGMKG
jgi:ABC-type sugar transport system, permease component